MSFRIYTGGKASRSKGLTVRLNKTGAALSKDLRAALPEGYEVAVDESSGQVAIIEGGPCTAHNGGHTRLGKALADLGAKPGDTFRHSGKAEPLPIALGDRTAMAFVFNVRPAGGKR